MQNLDRHEHTPWLFIIGCSAWLAALLAWGWLYIEDDAYIHLEFARNLAGGHGFAFQGRVTYGDSSPLWVMLLVGVHSVVPSWAITAKLLGLAGAVGALSGAYAIARSLAANLELPPIVARLSVALLMVQPYFLLWVFSGMEAVSALAVILWLSWLSVFATPGRGPWFLTCAIAGFAPLLRGELLLISTFTVLVASVRLGHKAGMNRRTVVLTISGWLVAVLPLMAWSIYAMRCFGTLVPNTYAAKRLLGQLRPSLATQIVRLIQLFLVGYGAECAVLASAASLLALLFLKSSRFRREQIRSLRPAPEMKTAMVFLVFWPVVLSLFYLANHTAVQTRYVLMAGPCLSIVAMVAVFALAKLLAASSSISRAALRAATIIAVAAMFGGAIVIDYLAAEPQLRNKAISSSGAMREMNQWIIQNVPADAPIAVYSLGQIAFEIPNPLLDTGGLVNPECQPYLSDPEAMWRWVKSKGARYAVIALGPEMQLLPDQIPIHSVQVCERGWKFSRHAYKESMPLVIVRITSNPAVQP